MFVKAWGSRDMGQMVHNKRVVKGLGCVTLKGLGYALDALGSGVRLRFRVRV